LDAGSAQGDRNTCDRPLLDLAATAAAAGNRDKTNSRHGKKYKKHLAFAHIFSFKFVNCKSWQGLSMPAQLATLCYLFWCFVK
jgi:hypothetical protein